MNACPNCGLVKGLHASILPGCMCPSTPQQTERVMTDSNGRKYVTTEPRRDRPTQFISAAIGDIRAFKHRIHELEGELIGYKKIVADQESIMTAQAMRIVDLKTHIENLEGEDR